MMISRLAVLAEHSALAMYYGALYLTPETLRNVRTAWRHGRSRYADWRGQSRAKRASTALGALCACGVVLGYALTARAQTDASAGVPVATTSPATNPSPAKLSAEAIALREVGNAALYNIDYAAARTNFEAVRKLHPQHPAGDLYLATTIWLEYLNRNRRLQTNLYRDDSRFYAGAENAKEETEGDAVDPTVDRAFRARIEQAKLKALALHQRDKKDVDALYYLGAVHGVLAGYEATTARKFFAAMRSGSRCVDMHQKALELKPDYHEALLSMGSYHYVVGNLPFALKALAALGGVRGDKKKGIAELQTLIAKNAANSDDARVLLLAIYKNERRTADALALLQELSAKYPASYLLRLEMATTLADQRKTDEAFATFEALLKDPQAAPIADLVHYEYAEALAQERDYARAATQFLAAAQAKTAEASLATIALLRAAQVYDLAGQRTLALTQYQAVLARPNAYDSREQAERGLKQPFTATASNEKKS